MKTENKPHLYMFRYKHNLDIPSVYIGMRKSKDLKSDDIFTGRYKGSSKILPYLEQLCEKKLCEKETSILLEFEWDEIDKLEKMESEYIRKVYELFPDKLLNNGYVKDGEWFLLDTDKKFEEDYPKEFTFLKQVEEKYEFIVINPLRILGLPQWFDIRENPLLVYDITRNPEENQAFIYTDKETGKHYLSDINDEVRFEVEGNKEFSNFVPNRITQIYIVKQPHKYNKGEFVFQAVVLFNANKPKNKVNQVGYNQPAQFRGWENYVDVMPTKFAASIIPRLKNKKMNHTCKIISNKERMVRAKERSKKLLGLQSHKL